MVRFRQSAQGRGPQRDSDRRVSDQSQADQRQAEGCVNLYAHIATGNPNSSRNGGSGKGAATPARMRRAIAAQASESRRSSMAAPAGGASSVAALENPWSASKVRRNARPGPNGRPFTFLGSPSARPPLSRQNATSG